MMLPMGRVPTCLLLTVTTVGALQFLLPRSVIMGLMSCLAESARAPVLNDVSTGMDVIRLFHLGAVFGTVWLDYRWLLFCLGKLDTDRNTFG